MAVANATNARGFARGADVRHEVEVWPEQGGWSMLVYSWRRSGVCGPSTSTVPMAGTVTVDSLDDALLDLGWTRLGDWLLERGRLVARVVPSEVDVTLGE